MRSQTGGDSAANIPDDAPAHPAIEALLAKFKNFTDYSQELDEKFAGADPEDSPYDCALPDNDAAATPNDDAPEATPLKDAAVGDAAVAGGKSERDAEIRAWARAHIPAEILNRHVALTFPESTRDNTCQPETGPFEDFIARFVVPQWGEKDGPAYLMGATDGKGRNDSNIVSHDLVALDHDDNVSLDDVERAIREKGLFAIISTTHSHNPNAKKKCRSTFMLSETEHFGDVPEERKKAQDEHSERLNGFGQSLRVSYDSRCLNAARLLFRPRWPKGAKIGAPWHEIRIIPGRMLTLDDMPRVPLTGTWEGKQAAAGGDTKRRDYKTKNMRAFLKDWSDDFEAAEFVRKKAPDIIADVGSMKLNCACPTSKHNDRRFLVENASDNPNEGNGFVMKCPHETCSGETRGSHLDNLCQQLDIKDAMELREYCPRWEEEQEAERKQRGDLDALLAALTLSATDAEINAVVRLIAALPTSDAKAALSIDAVRTKVPRLTKRQIEDMVRAVRRQMREEARANDGGNADWQPVPDDPANTTEIWLHWDEDIQKESAEKTFQRVNVAEPRVFIRPEGDVVVIQEDDDGAPRFKSADDDSSWDLHFEKAGIKFKRLGENDRAKTVSAPKVVCGRMRASTDLVLPHLDQIVTVPVFGPNGTLHTEKGYDKELKAYLNPAMEFIPPPTAPTEDDVDAALWWLAEAVRDFPFTDNFGGENEDLPIRLDPPELDDEGFPLPNLQRGRSSRVNFYAALLQPFARAMIKGPCPAYHFDKPGAGTGATKLASVITLIFDGKEADPSALSTDQEEIRKALTAHLRDSGNVLFFDNINHRVDSGALAGALTSGTWSDRLLGSSVKTKQPIRCLWIWAGNNVSFSHELMRRNVPIRLDAATPNPARDRGPDWYKHADLEGWIRENRAALVWACHTLIQNWVACGRPAGSATLASFEDWAAVMSGILESAGVPEGVFLGNIAPYLAEKDTEAGTYDGLVAAFASLPIMMHGGLTSTEMLAALEPTNPMDAGPFAELGITGLPPGKKAQALGKLVSKHLCGMTFRLPDGSLVKVVRTNKTSPSKYGLVPVGGKVPGGPDVSPAPWQG